jgi:hypothetical protein
MALVLADRGQSADAEKMIDEAMALASPTDAISIRGDVLLVRAKVLSCRGEVPQAVSAAREAFSLFDAKQNLIGATRARELATLIQRQ